jgi:hypothetical protein
MNFCEMVIGELLHFCEIFRGPPVLRCRGIGSPDTYQNRKWIYFDANILAIKPIVLSGTLNLKQNKYINV